VPLARGHKHNLYILNKSLSYKSINYTSRCNGVDIFACQTGNGNDQTLSSDNRIHSFPRFHFLPSCSAYLQGVNTGSTCQGRVAIDTDLARYARGSLKATASGVRSAWMTPPASSKARCTSSCRFWRYAGDLQAQTRI
jgi:hypothetical protein